MRRLAASTLALLVVACASGTKGTVTPEHIDGEIESHGARTTIEKLQGSQAWEESLQRIEEGDAEWLELAARLKTGADASSAVELDFSVARALKNNPQGVLKLLEGPFEAADVCTIPYIEASREVEMQHLNDVDRALREVTDEALAGPRGRCAEHILRITEKLTR